MRSAVSGFLCVLLLGSPRPAGAVVGCPTSSLTASGTTIASSDPSAYFEQDQPCPQFPGFNLGICSYDLPAGRVATSESAYAGGCGASADVIARDLYTLVGPDSSVEQSFQAQLVVAMFGAQASSGTVSIGDGTEAPASLTSHNGTLFFPVTRRAGQSFELDLESSVETPVASVGSYTASGELHFVGLPAGYSIVSCQGFRSGGAVPVARTSWGRLKQIYR